MEKDFSSTGQLRTKPNMEVQYFLLLVWCRVGISGSLSNCLFYENQEPGYCVSLACQLLFIPHSAPSLSFSAEPASPCWVPCSSAVYGALLTTQTIEQRLCWEVLAKPMRETRKTHVSQTKSLFRVSRTEGPAV